RRATDALDQFGRVLLYMRLEQVEDTAWMLQRLVYLDEAVVARLVYPGRAIVVAARLGIAQEQAVLVAEALLHQERGIGEVGGVFVLDLVVLQTVVDEPEQERDVGPLPDRCIEVGDRGGAREARIDDDELRATVSFRFRDPFEAARMGFGGVAAHDDNE